MKPGLKGFAQISGCESELFFIYKRNCKRRGVKFRLSPAEVKELTSQCCGYCGKPPRNSLRRSLFTFIYQGIDRKDNERGYIYDNVVPCCGECNSIKGKNLSHSEMLEVAQVLKRLRNY